MASKACCSPGLLQVKAITPSNWNNCIVAHRHIHIHVYSYKTNVHVAHTVILIYTLHYIETYTYVHTCTCTVILIYTQHYVEFCYDIYMHIHNKKDN